MAKVSNLGPSSPVPALVIAGVRSGAGKTTIATGIMGALTRRGLSVQPFKAGPDYIDPSYHALACGTPSRNLDTWMLPHPTVLELFRRASRQGQLSVVEGVMGVFDGHSNLSEEGSTAQLAKLLQAPVILVADASKVARSVAAEILGYQQFDPDLKIAGVVLNGVGGPRHLDFCKPQIEATTGLPVLGYLPRREELVQPERHLGLIPTVEGTVAREWYDCLIGQVEETFDLDRIVAIAQRAGGADTGEEPFPQESFPEEVQTKRAVIALAQDQAFSFYYQDSLDLLEAWGAELVPFSPLEDRQLPEGAGGVYLGGGFPEMFGAELAANTPMLESIREAAGRGAPIYAECGGLMYLGQSLTDLEGNEHAMAGVIPAVSRMSEKRLTLGYREVEAVADGPLLRKGQRVRGHEFHWSTLDPLPSPEAGHIPGGGPRQPGGRVPSGECLGFIHPRPLGKSSLVAAAFRGYLRGCFQEKGLVQGPALGREQEQTNLAGKAPSEESNVHRTGGTRGTTIGKGPAHQQGLGHRQHRQRQGKDDRGHGAALQGVGPGPAGHHAAVHQAFHGQFRGAAGSQEDRRGDAGHGGRVHLAITQP